MKDFLLVLEVMGMIKLMEQVIEHDQDSIEGILQACGDSSTVLPAHPHLCLFFTIRSHATTTTIVRLLKY